MQRRFLQVAIAVAGIVPVGAGLGGIIDGPHFAELTQTSGAASHLRYLSGLLLGIGLVFWASIPAIERHAARFRILTIIVFVGGIARLCGAVFVGDPLTHATIFALVMELIVTPTLCLWQQRVAKAAQ